MFITDTIESTFDPLPANMEIVSVAPLFADAIRSIHDRTSVSMLFPDTKPGTDDVRKRNVRVREMEKMSLPGCKKNVLINAVLVCYCFWHVPVAWDALVCSFDSAS